MSLFYMSMFFAEYVYPKKCMIFTMQNLWQSCIADAHSITETTDTCDTHPIVLF